MRVVQIVDASVLVNALVAKDARGLRAADLLRREGSVAPELIDIEVVQTLRKMVRRRIVPEREARRLVGQLDEIALVRRRHRPFLHRIWELRDNLTAYDATYVALAEALGCPLVTSDVKLAGAAGVRCEIVVLGD